jgi:hypothetical protein
MADPAPDATAIARQIVSSPRQRAKLFDDPRAAVAEAVPTKGPFGLTVDPDTKELRRQVLEKIPNEMKKGEKASSVHADAVIEQFFQEAIRNPELSFLSILGLSIATFLVGLALIAVGLARVFVGDVTTQEAVIASLFAGGGFAGALGSIYTLTRTGVSLANARHAQLRLILTGFATELGHLRAFELKELDKIEEVNGKIREAMKEAVNLIQTHVKVDPGEKEGESQGHS